MSGFSVLERLALASSVLAPQERALFDDLFLNGLSREEAGAKMGLQAAEVAAFADGVSVAAIKFVVAAIARGLQGVDGIALQRVPLAGGAETVEPANWQRHQRLIVRTRVLIGRLQGNASEADAGNATGQSREELVHQRT